MPIFQDHTSQPLVGRVHEQRQLENALDMLPSSPGVTMVIHGEPGIGKSLLLAHFIRSARERGLTVLQGCGRQHLQNSAFHTWNSALLSLLSAQSSDHRRDQLEQRLLPVPAIGEWLPLLEPVFHMGWRDTDHTRSLSGRARAEKTFQVLVALLRTFAKGLLVIVMDDAHWMDSASWALTRQVLDRMAPVMLVMAHRTQITLPDPLLAVRQHSGTLAMELTGLDAAALEALVVSHFGPCSPSLVSRLHRHTNGHPLNTLELVHGMLHQGIIVEADGLLDLKEPLTTDASVPLWPDDLPHPVTVRLRALDRHQHLLLQAASAIGSEFLQEQSFSLS